MIIDSLDNSGHTEKAHPQFKKVFDYLRSIDFSSLEEGKTHIEGDDLFFMVSTIEGKEREKAVLETHHKYIDIQLPVSAPEIFGWKPLCDLTDLSAIYNTEKDISFFKDTPETYFKIAPGNFVVFFPEDAHAPGIGNGAIKKIVVKVKV